jgi:hypothetical protein
MALNAGKKSFSKEELNKYNKLKAAKEEKKSSLAGASVRDKKQQELQIKAKIANGEDPKSARRQVMARYKKK